MPAHKHADLMLLFAEDASKSETPWLNWQWRPTPAAPWKDTKGPPRWYAGYEYRRRPKTIRIGEFDVPEPLRSAPANSTDVWCVDVHNGQAFCIWWGGQQYRPPEVAC